MLLVIPAAKADWPFVRGGADSTGATEVALPDEPKLLWTYDAEGASLETTPVVIGGVAYFGDADGAAHAVKLSDGSRVWRRQAEDTFYLSTGAVAGDAFVLPDADGLVRCFKRADGEVRWTFEAGAEVFGGPIVHEGLVLIPTEAGNLYALDAATGDERWSFTIEAPLRCAPTVVNGHALLAGCDGKLHTLNVATGEKAGDCDIGGPTGNTAAVADGVAYFGAEEGTFLAVDASDPSQPAVKWTYDDPKAGQGVRTAAALTPDAIVYANQAKTVYALRPADGEPVWRARTRSRVEASPLALAGGRVLIATTRGRLMLLDAATGETVWSDHLGGGFLAAPAASDGVVLIGSTDGLLYAFGKPQGGVGR
ncbi:Outer membrane protein assembly factor BamB precursor [Planctomycetes bacterium MalM25]|nr:Outer membrane protein assembly factor BamB precursor [Planctomycetes bacterium MalM25]